MCGGERSTLLAQGMLQFFNMKQGMWPINIITFCSFVRNLCLNIWVLFYMNQPVLSKVTLFFNKSKVSLKIHKNSNV